MTTYKIVRMYFREDVPNRTIKTGLSLEEAQSHCRDPETSSSTCTNPDALEHAAKYGEWFDTLEEEATAVMEA